MVLLLLISKLDRALAHSATELDEWTESWTKQADISLSSKLTAEWDDMIARHPWYFNPTPANQVTISRSSASGWSGSVEQWRPLVARYFPPADVDTAMRILNCETGGTGNPNSYNERSGASGLFQQLPKYWESRSTLAGWAGASIMDPEANVAVSAWLQQTGGWGHWACY